MVAVVVVVVVSLVAGCFAADRWLTGQHLFDGPSSSDIATLAPGHTIYVGLGPLFPTDTNVKAIIPVDLRTVRPLLTTNTSDATVTVLTWIHGTERSPRG